MRAHLNTLTYEELLPLCDSFGLAHPATKEQAIELLMGNCSDCLKSSKKNYTITYIYPQKTVTINTVKEKPCKTCGK